MPKTIVFVMVLLVSAVAGCFWLHQRLESPFPEVQPMDPHKALFDLTPVTVTVTAGDQRVAWHTSIHDVRTDWTLWRRLHLVDWNAVPEKLRQQGLDNMLVKYRGILMSPPAWAAMSPTDWDLVPQPIRPVAYRQMVAYWTGYYDVGAKYNIPPGLTLETGEHRAAA